MTFADGFRGAQSARRAFAAATRAARAGHVTQARVAVDMGRGWLDHAKTSARRLKAERRDPVLVRRLVVDIVRATELLGEARSELRA